ncbi:MAG: beta-ketoacyl synthase N-terminal-like domain-containing protein [Candidatus Acidiferrales bacterium]
MEEPKQSAELSQLKRALVAIQDLRARLDDVERRGSEPIAIIGMGCRFPGGATSPESYWELLASGADAVTKVPAERWKREDVARIDPEVAASEVIDWGGFLDHVDEFDPSFFGITPREANYMDPQQRLLLEVAWEALADAGQVKESLAGSGSGVFIGVHSHSADYQWLQLSSNSAIDVHTGTGTAHNVFPGRLSYLFDWHGPSVAIDTACSSSLVALHLAMQSLRAGECRLALAGGVNLILSPEASIVCAKMNLLSPEGRCKTFDASANGMVRGEGCGIVVLKRLSDALENRDPILALIRGSAVNQDGRTNGLTAPNGLSQQAVIRQALENAGVDGGEISYVETHGTGTTLGDPIEVDSLANVLGEGRPRGRVCVLGAAKASIGHLESAAGIAGLIKAVLAMRQQEIPAQTHFHKLNPHIVLGEVFEIPTKPHSWRKGAQRRFAGVSSFGWSGTNAHVILEEAPDLPERAAESANPSLPQLLNISAHTSEALRANAHAYIDFLATSENETLIRLEDICYTANARHTHLEYRLAVVGRTRRELISHLANFLEGKQDSATRSGRFDGDVRAEHRSTQPRPVIPSAPSREDAAARFALLAPLAEAYVAGANVEWQNFYSPEARCVPLPAYSWQRKKYWFDKGVAKGSHPHAAGSAGILPGKSVASPHPTFEIQIDFESFPYLRGHCVRGAALVPASMYLEIARTVAAQALGAGKWQIDGMTIVAPLVVAESSARTLQIIFGCGKNGDASFEIFSSAGAGSSDGARWDLHARGNIILEGAQHEAAKSELRDVEALRARCSRELSGKDLYLTIQQSGVELSGAFQTVEQLWRGDGEALGRVHLPEAAVGAGPEAAQTLLLDGALQVLVAATDFFVGSRSEAFVLVAVDTCWIDGALPSKIWSHARLRPARAHGSDNPVGDIEIFMESGRVVAELSGLHLQRAGAAQHDDWFYEVAWREMPLPGSAENSSSLEWIPSAAILAKQVEDVAGRLSESSAVERTKGQHREMELLSAQFVTRALLDLGLDFEPGRQFAETAVADGLRIASRHRRLFHRILGMLAEDGVLERSGANWTVVRKPVVRDAANECKKLASRHPEILTELTLLARCGERLGVVLRGDLDPLKLLFPVDSAITAAELYENSVTARLYNAFVREALVAALAGRPSSRSLRILEVGAGTGGTTRYLLDRLPADRIEYVFTDVSKLFLVDAAKRFAEHKFLRFELLDVEKDVVAQGFSTGSFDIILAASVLHATHNLRLTLANIRKLLAPGGLVLFLETTSPRRWVDLTFGLTDGWWKFTDHGVRESHPLLSSEKWLSLLRQEGFEAPAEIGQKRSENSVLEQTIVVARGPSVAKASNEDASTARTAKPGRWLILADDGARVGEPLADRLRAHGDECVLISANESAASAGKMRSIDPAQFDDYRKLLARTSPDSERPLAGIIHLWSANSTCESPRALEQLAEAQRLGCESALLLIRVLAEMPPKAQPKVWIVTRQAQPALEGAELLSVAQAPLWGFGRSIALEHPEFWGGLIDLESRSAPGADAERIAREILSRSGEDQVAWRGDSRRVARLVPGAISKGQPIVVRADGAYLVTGGLGGLGLVLAHWLVAEGARHIILIGRQGFANRARWDEFQAGSPEHARVEALRAIERLGAQIEIQKADVGDRGPMAAIFDDLAARGITVRGVFHAATLFEFLLLREMDVASLRAMLRAKIDGSWNLHELTRSLPLDFFVLFSSGTALVGAKASAHYAAGNQFLDALAHHRHALGLPALSIDWGEWEKTRGITAEQRRHVESSGWRPMNSTQALDAMRQLMSAGAVQQMVASFDAEVVKAAYEMRGRRPFLDEIRSRHRAPSKKEDDRPNLVSRLRDARPEERRDVLGAFVVDEVKRVMGLDASEAIDRDRGLFEMGLDSLMSVQLRSHFEASFGKSLPSTLVFSYPSVAALTEYLAKELLDGRPVAPSSAPESEIHREWKSVAHEIEQLSDEEVRAEIAREVNSSPQEPDE